jgi:homoserine dehydrogenase
LLANDLTEVYGIVNGTTNFILSKMTKDGLEFTEALKEAQNKGFAEVKPQKDIDGYDASYKAAILAGVAFCAKINWKDIYFEGIKRITQEDIRYADEIGYIIKLLAVAKKSAAGLEVRVHPTLISKDHPLASVSGPMNAIYVKGNAVGELMFYGPGAGGAPTASAIVGDIIAIVNPKFQMLNLNLKSLKIKSINEITSRYYIRLTAPDKHGVLAGISKAFADEKVSIAAVMQKEMTGKTATIVIIIHESKEANLRRAVAKLKKLSVVKKVCNVIRVGL